MTLPHHSEPLFLRLVQIISLPSKFNFLKQYADIQKAATLPPIPRQLFVSTISLDPVFLESYFTFVVTRVKSSHGHPAMISKWNKLTLEAIVQMRDAKIGEELVVSRIMPFVAQGLQMKRSTEFQVACYAVLTILASNRKFTATVCNAAMDALCQGWTKTSKRSGFMCLISLVHSRDDQDVITDKVVQSVLEDRYLHS
jgi:U3 small nucleolar RNA-associated protein 10